MPKSFKKILIANRGEIAVRVIRACKELGIRTVAVYSAPDEWSRHVAMADEAHLIGPAPPRESYLNAARILEVAKRSHADAIHPGYGFLSENVDFAKACEQDGVTFVGPKSETIRLAGHKVVARQVMSKEGIPTVPGTPGPVSPDQDLRAEAKRIGFPLVIKAAAGGGGKGMRVVTRQEDLARSLREAASEAKSAFGEGTVFLERYLQRPRHIEVQILGDSRGHCVHLGERECSIQRRHQKLIEETPSSFVDAGLRERLGAAALKVAEVVKYVNAGTVEFLVDPDRNFYFLEVNTRLQVEHPVTEMVTGLDLVKLQIAIAQGEALPFAQGDVRPRGHAIECRICAEDPFANFIPSTGQIVGLVEPAGPGIRLDTGVTAGDRVEVYYDSLIAKLVAWGETRKEATARLLRALREYKIVGVQTTIPFHLQALAHPAFTFGDLHTSFVEEHFSPNGQKREHEVEAAVLACALEFVRRKSDSPRANGNGIVHSPWKAAALRDGRRER